MSYRILTAAVVLAIAAAVPGSPQITYPRHDIAQLRLDTSSQFSPPFPIFGTWHLSELINSAHDNVILRGIYVSGLVKRFLVFRGCMRGGGRQKIL
jgi:hypothetical protein